MAIAVGYAFMAKKMSTMITVLGLPPPHTPRSCTAAEFDSPRLSPDPPAPHAAVCGSVVHRGHRLVFTPFDFEDDSGGQIFDVILHKLSEDITWRHQKPESTRKIDQILKYLDRCPMTAMIDHIDAVERVMSREASCEILSRVCDSQLRLHCQCPFRAPRWFVAHSHHDARETMRHGGGFSFPVICKPVAACGSRESHMLVVAIDESGLELTSAPFVVQEYTNHNGLLYKVYVINQDVNVYLRPSLPNLTHVDTLASSVVFDSQNSYPTLEHFLRSPTFADPRHNVRLEGKNGDSGLDTPTLERQEHSHLQIKSSTFIFSGPDSPCTPQSDTQAQRRKPSSADLAVDGRESISEIDRGPLIETARLLGSALGLSLFGFDVIRCASTGELIVVDVNYFPSYKEMEDFPQALYDLIIDKHTRHPDCISESF